MLGPDSGPSPLIICLHGSGDSCASWQSLARRLTSSHRILLYDRGAHNPKPPAAVSEMLTYLKENSLSPPYILVAHSYGGAIAQEFLHRHPDDVVGIILAETGQETVLDSNTGDVQYRRRVLGRKPLSVIRANSLIGKLAQLKASEATDDGTGRAELQWQRELFEKSDKGDERLKKRQLRLSRNSRYVHVPSCGHHVVRDRPDVLVKEVQ